MSMKNYSVLFLLLVIAFGACQNKSRTGSFKPGEIWKDNNGVHINAHGGGILFHDGRYWWFGEHKIEGEAGNKAQVGVHVYSSANLYDWKDEGIALPVVKDQPGHDIEQGSIIERPKVIYNKKTGKFVMWLHLERKGQGYLSARSGVAISDQIAGPYTYLYSLRPQAGIWPENGAYLKDWPVSPLVYKELSDADSYIHPDTLNILKRDFEGGQMARDQTLFVDDDEKAYHVYSSEENTTLHIAELTDDYTKHSGKYIRIFPGRYHEAPALFKRHNKYYFFSSYTNGWNPTDARSAVAPSIWGPWDELGTPCRGLDSAITFRSQSTYVLPVQGKKDAFIFLADRWNPKNAIDGRYVWLTIDFGNDKPILRWSNEWDLSYFK